MKRSNMERFVDVFDADPEINRLHAQLRALQRANPLPLAASRETRAQMAALHDRIDARAVELRGLGTTKNPGGTQ